MKRSIRIVCPWPSTDPLSHDHFESDALQPSKVLIRAREWAQDAPVEATARDSRRSALLRTWADLRGQHGSLARSNNAQALGESKASGRVDASEA